MISGETETTDRSSDRRPFLIYGNSIENTFPSLTVHFFTIAEREVREIIGSAAQLPSNRSLDVSE